jgi:hypothetical protein
LTTPRDHAIIRDARLAAGVFLRRVVGGSSVAMKIKREPGTLEVEHLLPPGAGAAWWRMTPISEPERPTRWVWAVLGVTVVFVLAGDSYYWLGKLRRAPAAERVIPQLNAANKVAGPAALATHPATQFSVGLAPLTSQQQPDAPPPAEAQSSPAAPEESPKFATGLRPITEQVPPNTPPPAAESAPTEPLSAPRPQPRAARRAASPSAAPGAPSPSSGHIKF